MKKIISGILTLSLAIILFANTAQRCQSRNRLPVILYYIEDFNIREIAQILDITEGAVQKRLARARGKLRCNLRESEAAI